MRCKDIVGEHIAPFMLHPPGKKEPVRDLKEAEAFSNARKSVPDVVVETSEGHRVMWGCNVGGPVGEFSDGFYLASVLFLFVLETANQQVIVPNQNTRAPWTVFASCSPRDLMKDLRSGA